MLGITVLRGLGFIASMKEWPQETQVHERNLNILALERDPHFGSC